MMMALSRQVEWEVQKDMLSQKKKKNVDFGDAPEKCGMASLQSLCGEDKNSIERRKLQAEQVRIPQSRAGIGNQQGGMTGVEMGGS
jgi:hypothetical protein